MARTDRVSNSKHKISPTRRTPVMQQARARPNTKTEKKKKSKNRSNKASNPHCKSAPCDRQLSFLNNHSSTPRSRKTGKKNERAPLFFQQNTCSYHSARSRGVRGYGDDSPSTFPKKKKKRKRKPCKNLHTTTAIVRARTRHIGQHHRRHPIPFNSKTAAHSADQEPSPYALMLSAHCKMRYSDILPDASTSSVSVAIFPLFFFLFFFSTIFFSSDWAGADGCASYIFGGHHGWSRAATATLLCRGCAAPEMGR